MLPRTRKSKRAVSVIVGYVLLIVFAIILGAITFTWIKTYVPSQQNLECQDGVSVFVKKSVFNDSTPEFPERLLKITVKNTGRFGVAGYFIHATNESSQELATIDLSGYLNDTFGGFILGNSVLFSPGTDNLLKSGEERNHVFDIPLELGTLHNVRITPVRYQEVENRNRFISCVNSRTEQIIGDDIGPPVCVPAADPTLSGICGAAVCGTALNGTAPNDCGNVDCGNCDNPLVPICSSGQCVECTLNSHCTVPGETCNVVNNMCEASAPPPLEESIVFVSSVESYDGNFGGIAGADLVCAGLVNDASLDGVFVAWLSNSTLNAGERLPDATFKTTNGDTVADNLADLLDGDIDIRIEYDETGTQKNKGKHVWTGTDGSGDNIAGLNCNDWTSSSSGVNGKRGETNKNDFKWTENSDKECSDNKNVLYCFEVDYTSYFCGNGYVESPETCDDGNTIDGDGCTSCNVDSGWTCNSAEPSVCTEDGGGGGGAPDCNNYCLVTLGGSHSYTSSWCPNNNGICTTGNPPGDPYSEGDAECSANGSPGSRCCCQPQGA